MLISGVTLTGTYITDVPPIVTSGLTLNIDAGNSTSYPGSGTTWFDLAGTADNITLVGSPAYTAGTPAYFTFNGATQYGTGSAANLLDTTAYTKSVWFQASSYVDNNLVSSDTGGHFMYMSGSSKLYCGHANWPVYSAYPSTATINLNTWYNAALTFSTTNGMVLYINGSQDSTYIANKTARSGDGSTNIACFGAGGNLLNGRLSQVLLYNRELTAAEVLQNYRALAWRYGQ